MAQQLLAGAGGRARKRGQLAGSRFRFLLQFSCCSAVTETRERGRSEGSICMRKTLSARYGEHYLLDLPKTGRERWAQGSERENGPESISRDQGWQSPTMKQRSEGRITVACGRCGKVPEEGIKRDRILLPQKKRPRMWVNLIRAETRASSAAALLHPPNPKQTPRAMT